MARLEAQDGSSFFELHPERARGGGETADQDEVSCLIRMEAFGEPIEGYATMTRAGLTHLIERLRVFTTRRTGMLQLRTETQTLELSLSAKRSKWTQRIRVTALKGLKPDDDADKVGGDELRVSFGVLFRHPVEREGAHVTVESRAGLVCSFDSLDTFAGELEEESRKVKRRDTSRQQGPDSDAQGK